MQKKKKKYEACGRKTNTRGKPAERMGEGDVLDRDREGRGEESFEIIWK